MGDNLGGGGNNTLTGQLTLNATSNVSTSWSDKSLTINGKITGAGGLQQDLFNTGNNGPLVILDANGFRQFATESAPRSTPAF